MKKNSGFTLMEFVMVIILLSILATVAIPRFIDMSSDARIATTQDRLQALRRAIVGDARVSAGGTYTFPGFRADLGRLPTALSELVTQGAMPTYDPINRTGWRGPYVDNTALSSYSTDAWGTAIVYSTSPQLLRSWGPNAANDAGAGDDITVTY